MPRPLTPLFNEEIRRGRPSPVPHIAVVPDCVPSLSLLDGITYDGNIGDGVDGDAVVIDGSYAYVASYYNRFTVFDISDPASLSVADSITSGDLNGVVSVIKDGDYCYVTANDANSLCIIDVSTPTSVSIVGVANDVGTVLSSPQGVAKVGDYCYVSGYQFVAIDVSTPTAPSVGSAISQVTINALSGMAVSGAYCFVCEQLTDSVCVVDISTAGSPSYVTKATSATHLPDPRLLELDGSLLVASSKNGDRIGFLDVSTPTTPSVTGSFTETKIDRPGGMVKSGDYLYVATRPTGPDGIAVYDISDLGSVVFVDYYADPDNDWTFGSSSLALSGSTLFLQAYYFASVDVGCP